MPIKQVTPQASIDAMIRKSVAQAEKAIINQLKYIGERGYIAIRDYSGKAYIDRTGNLRSSSGYVIFKDGKVLIKGKFETVKGGEKGAKEGEKFARSLAPKFPQGLVLVLVAGMQYAASVSSKGYNVLDSGTLTSEKLVNELKRKLRKNG